MTYSEKLEAVVREFGPTPERRSALRKALEDLVSEAFASREHGDAPFTHAEAKDHGEDRAFEAKVVGVREALLDALQVHERGKPCWTERTNVLAWLCHSLRVQPFMCVVERRLQEFEREHEAKK